MHKGRAKKAGHDVLNVNKLGLDDTKLTMMPCAKQRDKKSKITRA